MSRVDGPSNQNHITPNTSIQRDHAMISTSDSTASINDGKKLEENTQNVMLRLSNKEMNLSSKITSRDGDPKISAVFGRKISSAFIEHVAKHQPPQTTAMISNAAA